MEKKFEGENLIHLAGKKKKRSFWSFDFFDHLPLSVTIWIKIKILKALSQGWSLWKWVYVSSLNSEVQTKTTPTISILFAQAHLLGSARPLPADWGFFGLDMSTTYFYLNCNSLSLFLQCCVIFQRYPSLFVVVFSCFMENFFLLLWSYNLLCSILYRITNT